jgi:hypothetical protein
LCLHSSTPIKLSQELLHTLSACASLGGNSVTHLNVTAAVCFDQRLSLQLKYVYELTPQSQSQPNMASGALGAAGASVAADGAACISYTKNIFFGASEWIGINELPLEPWNVNMNVQQQRTR